MKNGNNLNSTPDTGKSFEEAYGAWDTLQEELDQQRRAEAEAAAVKKREEELAKGAKKYEKAVRDAIYKGDQTAFNEMAERDEHYRKMENGENRIDDERPYESSVLSQEEMAQAVKSSDEIQKMDLLARRIQNAGSDEAKAKFQQQLVELSNDFSKGEGAIAVKDWHDQSQWDFQEASQAEGFRQKVLDTIWEKAMETPKADDQENDNSNDDDQEPQVANNIDNQKVSVNYNVENNIDDQQAQNIDNADDQKVSVNYNVENNIDDGQKPEMIEQNEHEKKFDEMFLNGAAADELTRYRRSIRADFIHKGEMTPENKEMLKRMEKVSYAVGDIARENAKDTENNAEEKVGRFQKFKKKIGKNVLKILGLAGIGLAAYGAGYKTAESVHANNSEPKVENKTKTELSDVSATEFSKHASFDSSNAQEQEKNFNNGKYDSENNDYNKVDQKENQYSIGTSVAELSNEDFQKNMIESHSEDDIEYMGQFFVNDSEAAQQYLGMSNSEVDNLVDAARNGDQSAFQKLNEAYSNYMAGAKVVGQEALEGDYYSIFVNGDKNYAHSEGAFGGTARVVQLKNGQQILIRDQCKQLMMKKQVNVPSGWTTPTIPFEQTHTPPAPNTPPTPETPPETPPNTPPETPPETPPNTPPETPPETPPNTPPETPPETPPTPETKFTEDQSIYNYGGSVTRMDAGELTQAPTAAEEAGKATYDVAPGTETTIAAEGIDNSIDNSNIANQASQYGGEITTDQAAAQAAQQVEASANAQANAQDQNQSVNIGGQNISYDDIQRAQNGQ